MVTIDQINELAKNHETSSFALWSNEFSKKGCIERKQKCLDAVYNYICQENQSKHVLKDNVIFLAYNRSMKRKKHYRLRNFHRPSTSRKINNQIKRKRNHSNDIVLKKFIQENGLNNLLGGYMTDLSDKVGKDPKKVKVNQNDYLRFKEQLQILDQNKFYVICFGNDTFDALTTSDNFMVEKCSSFYQKMKTAILKYKDINNNTISLNVYKVYHYSSNYFWNILEKQLRKIDEIIIH